MIDPVGPIVEANDVGRAIAMAIRDANPGAEVIDRDAYLRIQVPHACRVTREAIELVLGRAFVLPGDLEMVMSSFAGRITITADRVEWTR